MAGGLAAWVRERAWLSSPAPAHPGVTRALATASAALAQATALAALALATAPATLAQTPRFDAQAAPALLSVLGVDKVSVSPLAQPALPVFYADAPNQVETVHCERTASFELIARASQSGQVLVAVCEREAGRVRALARDAQRGLAAVLAELRNGGLRIDEGRLAQQWRYRRVEAADGEEHHFPVLLIGHGILGPQTLVFTPRGEQRAVVIQTDVPRHCADGALQASTLCSDTPATLARLARQVLARTR